MSVTELGTSLINRVRDIAASEAEWLQWLREFDRNYDWALDGHVCCTSWLVDHCGMGRSTAKEKLRVAHELARRPRIVESFARGELTYSKVRALTRIVNFGDEIDEQLIEAAKVLTAPQVEQVPRHYELIEEQERPTEAMARWERRGLHTAKLLDEMASTEVVLPVEDNKRLLKIIDAIVEKAPMRDADDPMAPTNRAQKRADALVQLIEVGFANIADEKDVDLEIAAVDVVIDYEVLFERAKGTAAIGDGIPLSGEAARRLACDAGLVRIITRGKSEVLDVGRQTRQWNRAQRRAIRYRHHNQCAFRGCGRTILEIHHCQWWTRDGLTDLDAGVPLCWAHHRMVHEGGWTVSYDPIKAAAIFTSPDGHHIEAPSRMARDVLHELGRTGWPAD